VRAFSRLDVHPLIHDTCSLEAMAHPRNVGWGEIGLDYHYDNSPRDVQQDVFTRQLRHAVRLGKSITVHTREADGDTERILKAEVPAEHKVRNSSPC
jgi:TatD DNase family protein